LIVNSTLFARERPPAETTQVTVAPAPGADKQTNGQDQMIVVPKGVPAPPALLLAGIGVLALAGRSRLNRRQNATV